MGGLEGLFQRAAALLDRTDLGNHHLQEVAGLLDRGVDLRASAAHGAAATDQHLGAERLEGVESTCRPVTVEGITGVERGLRLDEVAREEDLLLRRSRDDVALGVSATDVLEHQIAAVSAEVDGQFVGERQGGPGESRH